MPSTSAENLTDIRAIVTVADGSRFMTGSEDGAIRMWTTEPLGRVQAKRAHHGGTFALAVVGDHTVFSAGGDGRVVRWQVTPNGFAGRTDVAALRSDEPVRAVAVRADIVAAGGDDRQVRLHDLARDRSFGVDAGFEVRALAFARNARILIAAGTRDGVGAVRAWRVLQNGFKEVAGRSLSGCHAVRCLLGVGGAVLVGADDGVLRMWDWTADSVELFEAGHSGPIHALAPVGERSVVSGGSDGMVLRWNLANRGNFRKTNLAFSGGVLALAVPANPNTAMVFAAGGGGEIRVLRHGEPVEKPFSGHSAAVRAIAVSDSGDLVVTGGADCTARMWGIDGKPEPIRIESDGPITAVAIWPGDDSRVVTACENGEITVWDRYDGTAVSGPYSHGARVWAVAVSPDGERILSGGNDGTVAVWNANNGTEAMMRWPSSIRAVAALAISGDGERVVIGGDDGTVSFRQLRHSFRPPITVAAVDGGQVSSVAVDHGGSLAAVGGQDGRVSLWNARSGENLGSIMTGHRDVRAVLLSTQDSTIVTCGRDGTIERWDYRTGARVGSVPWDLSGVVESIALMPDGKVIIAGGSAGELDLVHTRPEPEEPRVDDGDDSDSAVDRSSLSEDPHPYLVGDVPAHDDAIGNGRDVRMLAHLLAARHTSAPLSVALVGDWGAGKTSTMVQILERVAALSASVADDDRKPFWVRHVRQVRFNAWHYSDDHLWTGLVEQIMDGLRPVVADPDPRHTRDQLRERQAHLETARDALAEPVRRSGRAWWWLGGFGRAVRGLWKAFDETAKIQLDTARDGLRDVRRRFRNRGIVAGLISAGIAVGAVVLAIAGRSWWAEAYQWLWSTGAAALGLLVAVTAGAKRFSDTVGEVSQSLNSEIEAELARTEADLGAIDPVVELAAVLRTVTEPDRYEGYRGLTGTVHRDLRDLADVLDRARADSSAAAAGVPERIILYVDDLDRCPPERVVHVLQAVNLLMTLPVFIAVVTVEPPSLLRALDACHSATTTEPAQLRTLALALLDKVFNLVFTLTPLADRAPDYLTTLIHDLAPPPPRPAASGAGRSVREDAGPLGPSGQPSEAGYDGTDESRRTEPLARAHRLPPPEPGYRPSAERLQVTAEETALLRTLTSLLPGPRAVKKLTNVYRLILADVYHRRPQFPTDEYKPAAVMAAALIHAPAEFPALIDRLTASPCDHAADTHTDIRAVLNPDFAPAPPPASAPGPASPGHTDLHPGGPDVAHGQPHQLPLAVADTERTGPGAAEPRHTNAGRAGVVDLVISHAHPHPNGSNGSASAPAADRPPALSPALFACVSALITADSSFPTCAETYRAWSLRVARFGFETYRYFTPD